MKKIAVLCSAFFVVAGLASCKQKEPSLATIGSDTISNTTFQERVSETPREYQSYINTDMGKKQFLDLLVREKVILESAKQAGVSKKDDYKKSVADFQKEQERQMKDYKNNLLIEMYLTDVQTNSLNVKPEEIQKYYDEHANDYQQPSEIVAKHILVPTQEQAQTILTKLKSGEKFENLAKEFSTDKISAQRGGEIGPFKKNDLVPEFENVVFAMKDGEVSDIVKTPFGYHIILKVSSKALPPQTLEAASADIKRLLEKTKFDAWFENAKKQLNVTVHYDMLNTIKNENIPTNTNSEQAAQ